MNIKLKNYNASKIKIYEKFYTSKNIESIKLNSLSYTNFNFTQVILDEKNAAAQWFQSFVDILGERVFADLE